MTDYAIKYETARDRVLGDLSSLSWVGWKILRRNGGVRYSARLLELKRLGYQVEDKPDPSGDGKQYRLLSLTPGMPQGKLVKVFMHESDVERIICGDVPVRAVDAMVEALRIFKSNKHKL